MRFFIILFFMFFSFFVNAMQENIITIDFRFGNNDNCPLSHVPMWLQKKIPRREYENYRYSAWLEFEAQKAACLKQIASLATNNYNCLKIIFPVSINKFIKNNTKTTQERVINISNYMQDTAYVDPLEVFKNILTSSKITHLDLSDNHTAPWPDLANILKNNTYITYLKLSNLGEAQKEALKYLLPVISRDKIIKHLDLSDNNAAQELINISYWLGENNTIITLDLSRCYLCEEWGCFQDIAALIKKNTSLENLILRDNSLGCDGMEQIIDSLNYNNKLLCLDISMIDYYNFNSSYIKKFVSLLSRYASCEFLLSQFLEDEDLPDEEVWPRKASIILKREMLENIPQYCLTVTKIHIGTSSNYKLTNLGK